MAEPFVFRRIDVLLVELVQALDRDYPELPYGLVARCVDVARRVVDKRSSDDQASQLVAVVERVAREDLDMICASVTAAAL
jgi:hypothetical protein